jgi:mannan endo-1,4-beta-mannosidase
VAYFLAWNDAWAPIANKYSCAFYNNHRVINRAGTKLNNTLVVLSTTAAPLTTSLSASIVVYNFSKGLGQWQGLNVKAGPWQSNEFVVSSTDSLKADVQLSAGGKYALFTNQASTFTFTSYRRLVARARVATWGFSSGGSVVGKLYIKTGPSWTWYDSGAVTLNSNTATQITFNLSAVPAAALADVREVGVEYTASNNGDQSAVYLSFITAEN